MDGSFWDKRISPDTESTVGLNVYDGTNGTQRISNPTILHMDIEGNHSTLLSNLRNWRSGLVKACCNSAFIIFATIFVGFCISLVSFKLSGWSAGHELEQKYSDYHKYFVKKASHSVAAEHLKALTKLPHVAGSSADLYSAAYVQETFEKYGLKAHHKDYSVLLSYPLQRSVIVLFQNGSEIKLSLKETPLDKETKNSAESVIPPFHAYAPSGNVTADVVYVNYGRQEDYKKLNELGVNVTGAIVIARYGDIYRGDVIAIAERAGASAVILYSDPKDFAHGGTVGFYPNSEWLPPSGVQRGTVFEGTGDPLTPGWPSTPEGERLADAEVATLFPKIPSLPISADDALHIMKALGGPVAPADWHGSLQLPKYHVGKGPLKLSLDYKGINKRTIVRNVFAVIEGSTEPDRYVLLGNHRDAWTYGAVDPNSGTAALLEIARRFGKLRRHGWQPRRTIILCSWDAEEYGMIGSTEWVEQNMGLLYVKAVAYFNVDTAVAGSGFYASATPQLDVLIKEVAKKVNDPDDPGKSIFDTWSHSVSRLGGGGSDFIAFLQHVGIPSADMYFGKDYAVYHSLYDNFQWMEKFGDPTFKRLTAASTIWGLAGLRVADDPILPFHYVTYVNELKTYTEALKDKLERNGPAVNVTLQPLLSSISLFMDAVRLVDSEVEILSSMKADIESSLQLGNRARILNDRLMLAERGFIDSDGLKGSTWHKHLIYGPSKGNEYAAAYFPGIHDALSNARQSKDWEMVQHEIWRVARAIGRASLILQGQLL